MNGDRPWLVSFDRLVSAKEKQRLDRQAERIVTRAYVAACRDEDDAPRAFECAVKAYRKRYPASRPASPATPLPTFSPAASGDR